MRFGMRVTLRVLHIELFMFCASEIFSLVLVPGRRIFSTLTAFFLPH